MDESVKVAVEVRPRIRTCHFFVKSVHEPKSVKITDPNIISIEHGDDKEMSINVEHLNLTVDSVTGLQLTNDSLYFRTRSSPDNLRGSFRCELLTNNELSGEDDFSDNYKPDIEIGTKSQLYCRCCSTPLLQEETIFGRILPLPDSDGSDFFCHKHGENFIDLNPKLGDCFYSNFYFRINTMHVLIKPNVGIMYCPHCNSWLGISEEVYVTLWNSCVKLNIDDAEVKEQALEDFVSLVKALVKKQLGVTCKIIFNARVNDDGNHYLLLWVMDKSLTLFVDDAYQNGKLSLKEIKVAKVLYTYEELDADIVRQWKQDIKTNEEEISMPMMKEGLRLLEDMANIIPDDFRKANQLSVSYIK